MLVPLSNTTRFLTVAMSLCNFLSFLLPYTHELATLDFKCLKHRQALLKLNLEKEFQETFAS